MIDYKEITLGDAEQLESCYCDGDNKTIWKED